jgi:hypothetical protein
MVSKIYPSIIFKMFSANQIYLFSEIDISWFKFGGKRIGLLRKLYKMGKKPT